MADLIDRDVLLTKYKAHKKFFLDGWGGFDALPPADKARVDELDNCIADAINMPTVDAVEVVHGRWEDHPHAYGFKRCSACNDCNIWGEWANGKKWSYCPQCGARMDLEG